MSSRSWREISLRIALCITFLAFTFSGLLSRHCLELALDSSLCPCAQSLEALVELSLAFSGFAFFQAVVLSITSWLFFAYLARSFSFSSSLCLFLYLALASFFRFFLSSGVRRVLGAFPGPGLLSLGAPLPGFSDVSLELDGLILTQKFFIW
jgi:hypothetical protein